MAHSPHAHILEQARLSLAPGHVARRANAYLIALVSRSAAMMTWENHASAIPLPHHPSLTLAGVRIVSRIVSLAAAVHAAATQGERPNSRDAHTPPATLHTPYPEARC